jgi:uncharacterized membrane protein YccC
LRHITAAVTKLRNFNFYSERTINSFKTALACIIGLVIIRYFQIPMGQWTIITIIVIMSAQTRLGGALQRSYARTLGTLCGASVGLLALALFNNNHLAYGIILFLAVLFFSYIATSSSNISNAGTIGATTLAIILVNQNPGFSYAIERFIEILGGIAIALLVSVSVFPIYARKVLLHNFAHTCQLFAQFYQSNLCPPTDTIQQETPLPSEEDIIKLLVTQRQLIKETATEQRKSRRKTDILKKIINCEREIFHAILLMTNSVHESPEAAALIQQIPPLNTFHHDVIQQFNNLAQLFKKQPVTLDLAALNASLNEIEAVITRISLHQTLNVMINVYSYLFCAKIIVKKIQEFAELELANHATQRNT